MAPPAPPRFSTITGCPSCLASALLTTRAMTSDDPPAGYGTIRLTGLDGKASAAWAPNVMRRPATQAVRVLLRFIAVLRDWGLAPACIAQQQGSTDGKNRGLSGKDNIFATMISVCCHEPGLE